MDGVMRLEDPVAVISVEDTRDVYTFSKPASSASFALADAKVAYRADGPVPAVPVVGKLNYAKRFAPPRAVRDP